MTKEFSRVKMNCQMRSTNNKLKREIEKINHDLTRELKQLGTKIKKGF